MVMVKESKAEYLIQQLNASNAKKVALLIVIGFICYHGLLHLKHGSDSCNNLLSNGRLKGNQEWQPFGCMTHYYTPIDTRRCLRYLAFWGNQNHFVFIGDSRIRILYEAFIDFMRPLYDDEEEVRRRRKEAQTHNGTVKEDMNTDLEYVDYKLRLRVNYIFADELPKIVQAFNKWQRDLDPPRAVIASCTYKEVFQGNLTEAILHEFNWQLYKLVKPIDDLVAKKSKILWRLQDPLNEDYFKRLDGLTENVKSQEAWHNIRNADLDRLNNIMSDVISYSEGNLWSSGRSIARGLIDEMKEGYKLGPLALKHNLQIILNMYCNDNMNYNDGSCCASSEPATVLQIVTYAIFGVCIALSIGILVRQWWQRIRGIPVYMSLNPMGEETFQDEMDTSCMAASNPHEAGGAAAAGPAGGLTNTTTTTTTQSKMTILEDLETPVFALTSLAIIMAYFYLCTNFFMKENKYYSEFSFWIPIGYVLVLGLFFTEDSRYTKILHRDQTDEIKGWMQLVILIYHMTGAEQVLPIYMHAKLLISGFLFLSGYGHFIYSFKTGNNGFVRFCQILFRLNFATIVLCFAMNRGYQFYHLVPLLSFWYCVIYFMLALPPQITQLNCDQNPAYQYLYLVLKLVGILAIVTVFYMSEVFFERIFVTRPWKALFVNADDEIQLWWYRWKLDRYSITFGIIFALLIELGQKFNAFDDNNRGNLFSKRISLAATLLGFLSLGFYLIFSVFCQNKQNCEEIHSYIAFVPIVGYIVLRNISGILRTRYSAFFAWFGKISLELFICQYHIWLAADRNGVLVLIPDFPTLNMIITSFIFVCASHEVHRITLVLLPYAVPNDWKLVLRNLLVFLIILIPIARYDGMF